MKTFLFYGLLWNCLFVHKLSLFHKQTLFLYYQYIAHHITDMLSNKLPFLSYNCTSCWLYLSHLGAYFWQCLCVSYFHINDKDSFLHMVWDLPTSSKSKSVSCDLIVSVPLSFYYFWNQSYPVSKNMFKINNSNTSTRFEICSKLTLKTSEQSYWCHSSVFILLFEHISHLVIVFLVLTLSR